MVLTDPIADYLTRIRNANMVRHESLVVLCIKDEEDISEILKREGSSVTTKLSMMTSKA